MKVWARAKHVGDYYIPANVNIATAVQGFIDLGAEIILYDDFSEILQWITRDDIVLSFIGEVERVFAKFDTEASVVDYPEELKSYLGRNVWNDNLREVQADKNKWGVFVKPVEEKVFTGKVFRKLEDFTNLNIKKDIQVLCSELLNIKQEWRCFICNDSILDIRPYGSTNNFKYHFDFSVVESLLKDFTTWCARPAGCSLDICVTSDMRTLLVEVNDGYSLSSYGLDKIKYAKLISARWSQLLDRHDIFSFGIKSNYF